MKSLGKVSGILILAMGIVGGLLLVASRAQEEDAPTIEGYRPPHSAFESRPAEKTNPAEDVPPLPPTPTPVGEPDCGITYVKPKPQYDMSKSPYAPYAPPKTYALLGTVLFSGVTRVYFAGPGMPANPDGTLGALVAEDGKTAINIYERYISQNVWAPDGTIHRTIYVYDKIGRIEQVISTGQNQPCQNTIRQTF